MEMSVSVLSKYFSITVLSILDISSFGTSSRKDEYFALFRKKVIPKTIIINAVTK